MNKNLRSKKLKALLSILRGKQNDVPETLPNISLPKILSKCSEVTMEQFIKCICDNDLKQLITEGEAAAEQLAQAWTNLFLEYCELAEAHEAKHRVILEGQIMLFTRKNEICQAWLTIITHRPSVKLNEALQMFYDYTLDSSDPKQYKKDIAQIHSELIAERFDIKVKQAELEAIKNSSTKSDTVDRKYFTTVFTRINNYCKREAVNMQTTVEMYCAALRDFSASLQLKDIK